MSIQLINGFEEQILTYNYFGLTMQQNNYALSLISFLLNKINPTLIIEFGTRTGGLSVLLQLYALYNKCKFITYDNDTSQHVPIHNDLFKLLNIDFRREDITNTIIIQDIEKLITENTGKTILFCDAGKAMEFNIYTDKLKTGDIALCHDYFEDLVQFEESKQLRIWHTCECTHEHLKDAAQRNNMKLFMNNVFKLCAWGVYEKQ